MNQPRFETGKPLLIAGLTAPYTNESAKNIPAQWQRFDPYLDNIPGTPDRIVYGVIYNGGKDGFDYLCGVEVSASAPVPEGLTRLSIPEQRYAVFSHPGHVSKLRDTFQSIFTQWLPTSGHTHAQAPTLERYEEGFDPQTSIGGIEIWIPIIA